MVSWRFRICYQGSKRLAYPHTCFVLLDYCTFDPPIWCLLLWHWMAYPKKSATGGSGLICIQDSLLRYFFTKLPWLVVLVHKGIHLHSYSDPTTNSNPYFCVCLPKEVLSVLPVYST